MSDRLDDARMQTHNPGHRPAIRETGAATGDGSLPRLGTQARAPRVHTWLLGALREPRALGRERPATNSSVPDRPERCDAKNDLNSAGTAKTPGRSSSSGTPSEATRGRCEPEPLAGRQQTRLGLDARPLKSDSRPPSLARGL